MVDFLYFILVLHVFLFIFKGGDVHKIINEKGCLVAGEEWLERNLLVVAGIAVGVAFLQVRPFGPCPPQWFYVLLFVSFFTCWFGQGCGSAFIFSGSCCFSRC